MTTRRPVEPFELGSPWQGFDPFLFTAYHPDDYPRGNAGLGPDASLAGRPLGNDFGNPQGWNMYHGTTVPGFPAHPHRGFETITIALRGLVDHSDSLGAAARFGNGDVQWLTAGRGISHAEMFPLLDRDQGNPLELFQIWLNLPAAAKQVEPNFTMLWRDELPHHVEVGASGARAEVTVVAGAFGPVRQPVTPPDSWAADPAAGLAIWVLDVAEGGELALPVADGAVTRVIYLFDGPFEAEVGGVALHDGQGAVLDASRELPLIARRGRVRALVLQAAPIGEPVVQHGPFVAASRAELVRAFEDYQRTRFGGWPWSVDDPVHPASAGRFARYPDGHVARPEGEPTVTSR